MGHLVDDCVRLNCESKIPISSGRSTVFPIQRRGCGQSGFLQKSLQSLSTLVLRVPRSGARRFFSLPRFTLLAPISEGRRRVRSEIPSISGPENLRPTESETPTLSEGFFCPLFHRQLSAVSFRPAYLRSPHRAQPRAEILLYAVGCQL